jgi:hypothetical protein
MTVLANRSSSREAPRPAAASAEPEKRADPEPQPEIIKPVAEKTFKVPEWARNALAADPPVHFAQQKVPEKVPEPPQAASATEAYTEPIVASRPPVIAAPVAVQGETKKLTLTSPRSSRRKKEVQEELNLDD